MMETERHGGDSASKLRAVRGRSYEYRSVKARITLPCWNRIGSTDVNS